MFWIPLSLQIARAWSIFSIGMLVQVRCMQVSNPMYLVVLVQISRVAFRRESGKVSTGSRREAESRAWERDEKGE